MSGGAAALQMETALSPVKLSPPRPGDPPSKQYQLLNVETVILPASAFPRVLVLGLGNPSLRT